MDHYIYPPCQVDLLSHEDKTRIVTALGTRWTDWLLDLESGVNPVKHDLSATILFEALRPYAHPYPHSLLFDYTVELARACGALHNYLTGFGKPELIEFEQLDPEVIVSILETDVDRAVWNIVTDQPACNRCVNKAPGPHAWMVAEPGSVYCALCRAQMRVAS